MIFNEIFYSIQGEGMHSGAPSIFVRFGNCNLKCSWCDTKYTWHPDERDNISIETAAVVEKIDVLSKQYGCKRLVITGGEPLLQQNEIVAIRSRFLDFYIEVETNGSQIISSPCFDVVDLFTVSYKTSNSGNAPYELKAASEKSIYKFVVDTPEDFVEIESLIQKYNLPSEKIWFMPQGITPAQLESRSSWIVDYCLKHGYHFTTRLHVLLWGAKRGT